ncbi:carbohydrate-binding protein [Lachnospiraceae bacterium]|nr:carbohydrate-binding protein [Lachnospiraceae bacterium]
MAVLTLKVMDKDGKEICRDTGEKQVSLVYGAEYREGDRIVLETSEKNIHVWIQLDDALGASLCYVTGDMSYEIPFGEKKICYSPKVFSGGKHYLCAKCAREDEVYAYRNLALNVCDQHGDTHCYPHAWANVETRGESVFAARNAIDGVCENRSHGEWPYGSWGINRRDDAEMTVEFGRQIKTDRIVLYTRADFPHDNWWKQVTLTFSDGSSLEWELEKSRLPHEITFPAKRISWVKLEKLIKADDPSPFPALTQMEVYGKDICG